MNRTVKFFATIFCVWAVLCLGPQSWSSADYSHGHGKPAPIQIQPQPDYWVCWVIVVVIIIIVAGILIRGLLKMCRCLPGAAQDPPTNAPPVFTNNYPALSSSVDLIQPTMYGDGPSVALESRDAADGQWFGQFRMVPQDLGTNLLMLVYDPAGNLIQSNLMPVLVINGQRYAGGDFTAALTRPVNPTNAFFRFHQQ